MWLINTSSLQAIIIEKRVFLSLLKPKAFNGHIIKPSYLFLFLLFFIYENFRRKTSQLKNIEGLVLLKKCQHSFSYIFAFVT